MGTYSAIKRIMCCLLAVCMALTLATAGVTAADSSRFTIKVTYDQSEARKMLDLINEFRTGSEAWQYDASNKKEVFKNLGRMRYDYELEKVAMSRAAEIAYNFSHTRPNGKSCFTASTKPYANCYQGENIAAGFKTAADAMEAFKETDESYNGQGHRRNMLRSVYTSFAVGHAVVNGVHYWVQEFASVVGSSKVTSPVNRSKSVTIEVTSSMVKNKNVSASKSSLKVKVDGKAELPSVTAEVTLRYAWPDTNKMKSTVPCKWTVKDTSIAKIKGSKICGLKKGTTSVSTTVCGKRLTVTVKVK